jgi:hypothetical protein
MKKPIYINSLYIVIIMTKISDAETSSLSSKNMKDFTRKASVNEVPEHEDTYTQIEPHALSFVSPALSADILHNHKRFLASPTSHILSYASLHISLHPMSEAVGMHHVK